MHDLIAGSAVNQKSLKVHLHAYMRIFITRCYLSSLWHSLSCSEDKWRIKQTFSVLVNPHHPSIPLFSPNHRSWINSITVKSTLPCLKPTKRAFYMGFKWSNTRFCQIRMAQGLIKNVKSGSALVDKLLQNWDKYISRRKPSLCPLRQTKKLLTQNNKHKCNIKHPIHNWSQKLLKAEVCNLAWQNRTAHDKRVFWK